jgi:DNA-binding transcriptional ArsR family regulator
MAFSRKDHFAADPRQIADASLALSHPARVKIIQYLSAHGDTSFTDLQRVIPLHRTTVSQHLRLLRRHGLVLVYEEVPHTYYMLNSEAMKSALLLLSQFKEELERE